MYRLERIYAFVSYFPLLWFTLFISFAIRATIALGHVPIPSLNDPKDLGFYFHHNLVWVLFFGMTIVFPIWIFLTIFLKVNNPRTANLLKHVLIFTCTMIVLILFRHVDPFHLMEWFAD